MLVRGTDEIVGLYILNYSLLLLWGISSVLVEALWGPKNNATSFFSAFFALVIGCLCALVHILIPVERRRRTTTGTPTDAGPQVCTPDLASEQINLEFCATLLVLSFLCVGSYLPGDLS